MNGNQIDSQRFDQIHQWVTKLLEGSATEAEQRALQDAVTSDEEHRQEYIRYIQESVQIASRLVHSQKPDAISNSQALELLDDENGVFCEGPSDARLQLSRSNMDVTEDGRRCANRCDHSYLHLYSNIAISAAVILVASLATWYSIERSGDTSDREAITIRPGASSVLAPDVEVHVATLLESNDVVWDNQQTPVHELSRVSVGQKLCIHRGTLKLVFDSGVETLILAPCHLQVQDRDRLYCSYGRITAKASKTGRGFMIETPVARVTDLGTEFGIAIGDSGETEVAVFEGEVDVEHSPAKLRGDSEANLKREHLVQGQATIIGPHGQSRRVFSVDNKRLPQVRELAPLHFSRPVISDVRDNISERNPETRMFYRIIHAGLREDSRAFVDRHHQWNGVTKEGIPEMLIGADYVMPFNDDKFAADLRVQVSIAEPATVYIFFNDNTPVPEWLSTEFVDTGLDIGLDEAASRFKTRKKLKTGPAAGIDSTFSIWKRDVNEPQDIELGSFARPTNVQLGYNMYGIAAVPH